MDIDIETINRALSCNFSKKCLEGLDTSSCCTIEERKDHFLIVKPVSTFKSSNCAYRQLIKKGSQEIMICSCPVRIEIFDKHGK